MLMLVNHRLRNFQHYDSHHICLDHCLNLLGWRPKRAVSSPCCVMYSFLNSHYSSINRLYDFAGNFFSVTWSWLWLCLPAVNFSVLSARPLVWGSKVSIAIPSTLLLMPIKKLFEISSNWLPGFFGLVLLLTSRNYVAWRIELYSTCKANKLQQNNPQ